MVGVPAFSMIWRCGAVGADGLALALACSFSQRISTGLMRKAISSAVITAAPERKVR